LFPRLPGWYSMITKKTKERSAGLRLRANLARSCPLIDMDGKHKKALSRELTKKERAAIRRLVITLCANYDNEYGCLILDGDCYMLNKWWTGAYCKYFQNAVLPVDPILEATLLGRVSPATERCAVCGASFMASGRQKYCSPACIKTGNRHKSRDRMRKKRKRG